MRKIFIHNEAGLGNRIFGIIGGLVAAEELKIKDVAIIWKPNNHCDCTFNKLFNNNTKVIENPEDYITSDKIMLSDYESKYSYLQKFNHSIYNIKIVSKRKEDVVYVNNNLMKYYEKERYINKLREMQINPQIVKIVKDFCSKNKIDNSVLGMHLRRTDFLYDIRQDEQVKSMITSTPEQKYFLCSDSKETENIFSNLKNVIIFPKKSYPRKKNEGNWLTVISSTEKKYNILRPEESVIEGFIDLLILSRTNLSSCDSRGTFFNLAKLYNKINF